MIRLRDKRTKKEVFATVEEGVQYGEIIFDPRADHEQELSLSSPGSSHKFSFGLDFPRGPDGTDTATDDYGDRLFVTKDYETVPERFLEPFCDGMSEREFLRHTVTLAFCGPKGEGLAGQIDKLLSSLFDEVACTNNVWLAQNHGPSEVLNATTMAMFIREIDLDPAACVKLDPHGRELKDGKVVKAVSSPASGVEVDRPRSHWDEVEGHPVEDWRSEVANDDTRLGYLAWVEARAGNDPDSYCRTCFVPYDGAGDGYDGECPDCADKNPNNQEEDHE